MGFRVQGLRFRVQGSGFRVQGLWLRVEGRGPRKTRCVSRYPCLILGAAGEAASGVSDFVFRGWVFGFWDRDLFEVQGSGCRLH